MEALLEQLVHSPKLPFFVEEMQTVLAAEQEKRQAFYEQITEDDKAEFINGEVIMHSPVRLGHNDANGLLYTLLSTYVRTHQLGFVGFEKIMISLTRNDYEPDLCFFKQDQAQSFTRDQLLFPAPDFIVEILSDSTARLDRGVKFEDYAAHGVTEYWLIDPQTDMVEQYVLENQAYILKQKSDTGFLTSVAVAGFKISVQAIFDPEENLKALQDILGSV